MADIKELENKVSVSWGLLKATHTLVAVTAFTITTVYWNFGVQTRELEYVKQQMTYEREREDRKVNPIEESVEAIEIKFLTDEIKRLKELVGDLKKGE